MVLSAKLNFSEEEYQQRIAEYRETALSNFNRQTIPIQAFLGEKVDQNTIDDIFGRISTNGEFDFNLVQLVRIMYFDPGKYEDQFLPVIQSIPLWLGPNEKTRVYWSENHITMWLSSAFLLNQKYGIVDDPELRKKLIHCLDLKINYGYYEFFSSVYFPYTLSGLLNLIDFSEDQEIKAKAILAAKRLLQEVLLLANDQGGFFPAAGRNYIDKYATAYQQNHSHIIYLLTGLGEKPKDASHAGAFLATSTFDVKEITESWNPVENKILRIGHTLQEGFQIHKDLLKSDKVIFQWSGGGYFHPDVALETATLLENYNLWEHKEFKMFKDFKGLPVALAPTIANVASSLSYSSLISDANVYVYKNHSVTLSSIQNYWKGRAGFQQFPWAATTGTIGVTTQSGKISNLLGEESLSANSNLPYIQQKDNVALIMYRPNKDLGLFGYDRHDVKLTWNGQLYDEVVFENKWIIGREGDNYVAVLRHCTDEIEGQYACDDQDGQLWSCVVGSKQMHGSFENFLQIIRKAKYQEKWNYVFDKVQWVYYGMVEVDGKKLEHNWVGDLASKPDDSKTDPLYTGVKDILKDQSIVVFPNPAKHQVTLSWSDTQTSLNSRVQLSDISGRLVFEKTVDLYPRQQMQIPLEGMSKGLYIFSIYTENGVRTQKIMIQ